MGDVDPALDDLATKLCTQMSHDHHRPSRSRSQTHGGGGGEEEILVSTAAPPPCQEPWNEDLISPLYTPLIDLRTWLPTDLDGYQPSKT